MSTTTVPREQHTRTRDPETSHDAAAGITAGEFTELQAHILELLTVEASTDDELYDRYRRAGFPPRSPQRVRTARSELDVAGKVFDSGVKKPSALGKYLSIVWTVTR